MLNYIGFKQSILTLNKVNMFTHIQHIGEKICITRIINAFAFIFIKVIKIFLNTTRPLTELVKLCSTTSAAAAAAAANGDVHGPVHVDGDRDVSFVHHRHCKPTHGYKCTHAEYAPTITYL